MDNNNTEEKWTYKKAGVDIEAGYEAVKKMKPHVARTVIPGVLEGLGGFGALFEMPSGYKEPVLVSGTDSVGSKVTIAFDMNIHNTIGIDCVAMCVNDIICMGAKPLFFLDYIGIGGLDPDKAALIIEGVSEGCVRAGCALVGGETCEMPDIYVPGEYDIVGFAVGVAEKSKLINGRRIKSGDVLIGLASTGLHSNGFTLVRRLVEAKAIKYTDHLDAYGKMLGEVLLTPTKIYARAIDKLINIVDIKGMANITGGAWYENIPRMLPSDCDNLKIQVHKDNVPVHKIFRLIQQWGKVDEKEMYSTFNMGLGMVICVSPENADKALAEIDVAGEKAFRIGTVEQRNEGEEKIVIV